MESEGIYHCRTQGRGAPGPGCRNSRGTRESGPGDSPTARRMPQPPAGSPGTGQTPGHWGAQAPRRPEARRGFWQLPPSEGEPWTTDDACHVYVRRCLHEYYSHLTSVRFSFFFCFLVIGTRCHHSRSVCFAFGVGHRRYAWVWNPSLRSTLWPRVAQSANGNTNIA